MSEDGASPAIRAIVAGHGEFATGLVSAVEMITGRGATLAAVSVTGLDAEEIERTLRERMLADGVHVLFTDLQAGSCSMAGRRILRGMPDAVLICGTNLPILLDFVFAEQMPPAKAARHAVERGRSAITVMGATE
jgi:PTS system N-acetylgalactosamine-specific IIA component